MRQNQPYTILMQTEIDMGNLKFRNFTDKSLQTERTMEPGARMESIETGIEPGIELWNPV